MRSAVHVHRTTIAEHNHVAALNVNWGAGDVNITHRYVIYSVISCLFTFISNKFFSVFISCLFTFFVYFLVKSLTTMLMESTSHMEEEIEMCHGLQSPTMWDMVLHFGSMKPPLIIQFTKKLSWLIPTFR